MIIGTPYLQEVLNPHFLQELVEKIISKINNLNLSFKAIAFRGTSGALIAPIIAYKLNKNIICIRKLEERNHSGYRMEGVRGNFDYIIIDDLIDSGATIRAITQGVNDGNSHYGKANCVGIILYRNKQLDKNIDGINIYAV